MAPARKGRRKAAADPPPAPASSPSYRPWRLRYAKRILTDDLPGIGHVAYETAKKTIKKKLPVDPEQYGEGLRSPLDAIYKLKSSHVRIAYHIEEPDHEVWVLMIADRKVIWDRHEDEILGRLEILRDEKRQRDGAKRQVRRGSKG